MSSVDAEHARRVERLRRALDRAAPQPGEAFECPYLPERQARHVVVAAPGLLPGAYHALMDLNFRRLGTVYYRPQCDGCQECRALRVAVAQHAPNRSQRRCLARNRDLAVHVARPEPDDEKFALYRRYLQLRHDGRMDGSREEFEDFLYAAPDAALETCYRDRDGRLVAVGLADVEPRALSAIYCYFDPDQAARSPGVFNVLWLLHECRRRGVPWLYLGYHVAASRKMAYKAAFEPHQILVEPGRWE
jgi:arginine-tRNA-protein transferase